MTCPRRCGSCRSRSLAPPSNGTPTGAPGWSCGSRGPGAGRAPAFTVTVATKGHPRPMRGPDGLAGWEELDDGVIVASQPHGAPSWFACNDRPSDKAAYRVTIACDAAYLVWANGRLAARRKVGRKTAWTWVQSEPMAPYLATLQIGRYAVRQLPDAPIPVRVVGRAGTVARRDGQCLRRPGTDDRGDAGVVRAVPVRGGLHRGRHRRRPGDPAGVARPSRPSAPTS